MRCVLCPPGRKNVEYIDSRSGVNDGVIDDDFRWIQLQRHCDASWYILRIILIEKERLAIVGEVVADDPDVV